MTQKVERCLPGYHWDPKQGRCVLDVPRIIETYWPEIEPELIEEEDFWSTLDGLELRLDLIAQGATWTAYNVAVSETLKALGVIYVQWVAELDDRTCPFCELQDGRVYKVSDFLPFLPIHPNCFAPDTLIHTRTGLKAIKEVQVGDSVLTHLGRYRPVLAMHQRLFEGKIYVLNGLRLTGNHRVLTPKGWQRTDSLNAGHQILLLKSNYRPSVISKVSFLSRILSAFTLRLMPVATINLNSNSVTKNSEVNIENMHSVFRNDVNSSLRESTLKHEFKRGKFASFLSGLRSQNPFFNGYLSASGGLMGGFDLSLSLLCSHLFPFERFRLALVSHLHHSVPQTNYNGGSAASVFLRQPVDRPTATIKINDLFIRQTDAFLNHLKATTLNDICTEQYKGLVHNLTVQEDESYLVGEGIAAHNCRCYWDAYEG